MEQKVLEWQHRAYHYYIINDLLNMNYGIWDFNRNMWYAMTCMKKDMGDKIEISDDDGAIHVFYIEYDGRIFTPKANMKISDFPTLTEDNLKLAIMCGALYELTGCDKELFIEEMQMMPDESLEMPEYYRSWLQELKQQGV